MKLISLITLFLLSTSSLLAFDTTEYKKLIDNDLDQESQVMMNKYLENPKNKHNQKKLRILKKTINTIRNIKNHDLSENLETYGNVTIYDCKTISLGVLFKVGGGSCFAVRINENGSVKTRTFGKAELGLILGIAAKFTKDTEVDRDTENDNIRGDLNLDSAFAYVIGGSIQWIDAEYGRNNDNTFFDFSRDYGLAASALEVYGSIHWNRDSKNNLNLNLSDSFMDLIKTHL